MQTDLVLLVISTIFKVITLVFLAFYFHNKWNQQRKKYYTDFPFLMAITNILYASIKIFDIYIYVSGFDSTTIITLEGTKWTTIKIIRFIISPVCTMGILAIITTMIWFGDNKRAKILFAIFWLSATIISLNNIDDLDAFYTIVGIFTVPVMILSIGTFIITHQQQKLPEINSLLIAIGYLSLTLAQLLRPIMMRTGMGHFGLSWLGELIELGSLLIIAYGYSHPASYSKKETKYIPSSEKKEVKETEKQEQEEISLKNTIIS